MSLDVFMAITKKLVAILPEILLHDSIDKKISINFHPTYAIQIIPQLAGENHLPKDQTSDIPGQILTDIGEREDATSLILTVFGCWLKCEAWTIY